MDNSNSSMVNMQMSMQRNAFKKYNCFNGGLLFYMFRKYFARLNLQVFSMKITIVGTANSAKLINIHGKPLVSLGTSKPRVTIIGQAINRLLTIKVVKLRIEPIMLNK